ncbi:BgtE-5723 [Blumeria graminis f. sp. tritici]|uniref:BgtE-5723 n=2 Tax=Blumeria graminis f. sp. tritici TaxID=62690 RepID=A0A381L8K5_BLUGR|nr:putative secreted effector protein [Blumeria graminis f. sp. tritici 96224]VDB93654.1 BgtE-5723 [Blumeria graminis f. sp. tritici]
MYCVVAILLVRSAINLSMNRLVLATNDHGEGSYSVYGKPDNYQFPTFPLHLRIFKTKTKVTVLGTHVALYCSYAMKSQGIVQRFALMLPTLTHCSHYGFSTVPQNADYCLNHISKSIPLQRGEVSVNQTMVNERICAPDTLAYLTYMDETSIYGIYSNFFPQKRSTYFNVNVNKMFNLKDLVLNGKILLIQPPRSSARGMAWIQGHLHIFETVLSAWVPETKIGHESQNGNKIFALIIQHYCLTFKTYSNLSIRLNYHLRIPENSYFNPIAHFRDTDHMQAQFAKQLGEIDLGILIPSNAVGKIMGATAHR